jgi:hypothetical protein
MEIRKAKRRAVPMLMSLTGVSGSGKTYSALLLAAGIAGPKGRVGFIDTENGRGEMYADSPGIVKALPDGYEYLRFDPPYSPERCIAAIDAMESAGVDVVVMDSGSHSWEGIGGCGEIAERHAIKGEPNWAKAKIQNRRFVYRLLAANMHVIVCLRGREKVKYLKTGDGKTQVIPIGIQPAAEKNFVFEMLLSLLVEEHTHHAQAIKCPEPLRDLFSEKRLITADDGRRIAEWNSGAPQFDPIEQVLKRGRAAANDGTEAYRLFFESLSKEHKKYLAEVGAHDQYKALAIGADESVKASEVYAGAE